MCDCAYLHYISDEYLITVGGKTPKRKLLRGGVMYSTISMGQVGLAFSQRQQCLFKIKIGTFKDIKVWSSQGLKQHQFPNVIHNRQTDRKLTIFVHAR